MQDGAVAVALALPGIWQGHRGQASTEEGGAGPWLRPLAIKFSPTTAARALPLASRELGVLNLGVSSHLLSERKPGSLGHVLQTSP